MKAAGRNAVALVSLVALVALLVPLPPATAQTRRATPPQGVIDTMEKIRLVGIKALRHPSIPVPGGSVDTDEQGELQVDSAEDWTVLQFCQANGEPAAIRFDPILKRLSLAWPADDDVVTGVDGTDNSKAPRVVVHLRKRPTLLYLDRSSERFGRNIALLRDALKSRQGVVVAVFPGSSDIEDVRLVLKR